MRGTRNVGETLGAPWSCAANAGHDLLKKKRDALRKEHRSMAEAIFKVRSSTQPPSLPTALACPFHTVQTKKALQSASTNSFFAIDDAVWSAGEFKCVAASSLEPRWVHHTLSSQAEVAERHIHHPISSSDREARQRGWGIPPPFPCHPG